MIFPVLIMQLGSIQVYYHGERDVMGSPTNVQYVCPELGMKFGPFRSVADALTHLNMNAAAIPYKSDMAVIPITPRSNVVHVDFRLKKRL